MRIRLGYACISETINETTSTNYTYTSFLKENSYNKLDNIIVSNLNSLYNILNYNKKNNIHFYRMSSKLIPLSTKKEVVFDYIYKYKSYYEKIGKLSSKMRLDFHPDHFCVINSTKEDVIKNSIDILEYHYNILNALNIKDKVLVLHVGSGTLGKDNSIKRFINSFNKLPIYLKESIALENDDKIFNIEDVTYISNILNIPIVLDYHHHMCNNSIIDFESIFKSWKKTNPKIHFSSPKNKKEFRSHSDYINSDDFISFIELIKDYPYDIDIMIEAKKKDEALFRLIRQLKYKTNYLFIDETTFIV